MVPFPMKSCRESVAQPNSAPASGCGRSTVRPFRWVILEICTIATM